MPHSKVCESLQSARVWEHLLEQLQTWCLIMLEHEHSSLCCHQWSKSRLRMQDMNLHSCMKRLNNVDKIIGATELADDCLQAISIYRVKGFSKIDTTTYRFWICSHFSWICWSAKIMSEVPLLKQKPQWLSGNIFSASWLVSSGKEQDAMMVIARSVSTFPFLKVNNFGIFKFLLFPKPRIEARELPD